MAKTYQMIYYIKDPKEKLFAIMDRLEEIRNIPTAWQTPKEVLEAENLERLKMNAYSDWKDPK